MPTRPSGRRRGIGTEENNNELVASARVFGGVAVRVFGSGAGNHFESAPSAAAVFDRTPESAGTVVCENHRRIQKPHQVPDLSVDATRRFRAAALRSGQGRRGGRNLDGRGLFGGAFSGGGTTRAAALYSWWRKPPPRG